MTIFEIRTGGWRLADWRLGGHRCARLFAAGMIGLVLSFALSAAAKEDDDEPAKSTAKPAAKIPAEAKEALDAAGLKVVGTNLTLAGEGELSKMFADVAKKKKAVIGAEREYRSVEADVEEMKTELRNLKAKHIQLSAQLAQGGNAADHNRLVGEANAIAGQIDLGRDQEKASDARVKEALAKASDARDNYVELLLGMRALANEIAEKWTTLAADSGLQEAVTAAGEATGKKLKLAPSPSFVAAEKKLQALEHTVLSESIPLTADGSSLSVAVTVNGKHRYDMMVDSGSSSVLLPYATAKAMGLEPKSSDRKITCVLADGSEVQGTLIKLASVRVGKFTVDDVECVVLEREAVNATPLLGMSFLGNFTFEIDKQKSELRMVKVEAGESGGKSKVGSAKPKPGKSKPGKKPKDDMD